VYLFTSIISSSLLMLQAFPSIASGFVPVLIINGALSAFVAGGVLDAYCLEYLAQFDATRRYGQIRLWTAVSWGLGSVAMGFLTDYAGGDFTYNFALFGAMSLARVGSIWYFIPSKNHTKSTARTFLPDSHNDAEEAAEDLFNQHSLQERSASRRIRIDQGRPAMGSLSSMSDPSSSYRSNWSSDIASSANDSQDVVIVSPPILPRQTTSHGQLKQSLLSLDARRYSEDLSASNSEEGESETRHRYDEEEEEYDDEESRVPLREVFKTVCEARFLWFLAEVMILGAGIGVVERLLFVYLQNDLKASTTLCGLTVGVTVLFELPIFAYTDSLLKSLGHDGMFTLAMLAFCVRCYGYTLLTEETKWWILALEALHGVTFALMWSAAVEFAKDKSPKGWDSTMQAVLVTTWRCLGLGIGAAVGGWVMDHYGARYMYRGTSFIVGGFFVLHVMFATAAWCSRWCGEGRGGD
jgi:MFS family permease